MCEKCTEGLSVIDKGEGVKDAGPKFALNMFGKKLNKEFHKMGQDSVFIIKKEDGTEVNILLE